MRVSVNPNSVTDAVSRIFRLGFNLVATAPDLEHALAGWSLFGFSVCILQYALERT